MVGAARGCSREVDEGMLSQTKVTNCSDGQSVCIPCRLDISVKYYQQ